MPLSKNIKLYRMLKDISQEELAKRVSATADDVNSWESGETVPDEYTLKLISRELDETVSHLTDSTEMLVCQCCGMPLDKVTISKNPDGTFNEEYCRWCYTDGKFTYDNMDVLMDFIVTNYSTEQTPPEKMREFLNKTLPNLKYWKNK